VEHVRPIDGGMLSWLVLSAVYTTLFQGMLVAAKWLPPACARCGLRLERRRMGERVCRCHSQD
jgi:hypothetical protein